MLFYFSLNKPRPPLAASWLVSGVVDALNVEDAKRRLYESSKGSINPDDFDFVTLDTPRSPFGIVAITVARE